MQATSVVTVIEPGRSARRTPRSPEKRPGRAPPRPLLPESLCGITCGLSVGPRPHAVDVRTPGPRRGAPGSWDRRTCHSQLPSRHSCFELFFFPFLLNHERGLKSSGLFVFLGPPSEAIARVSPQPRPIRQSSSAARPRAPGSSGIAAFSRCRARLAVASRGFASPLAAGSRAARGPLTAPLSGAGVRSRPPRVPLSLGFAHRRSGRAVRSCR